ncbi:alanine racemase [Marinobacterium sp. AK62]|uniref:Alanine racemase n=1 Tax=Marinobacterium alkalitolerans TaxID=1542925 RepID=A0ABS3Z6Q8_9GAMM|nr:alanine racemase [Marinobacterium alkalitolerans]MBP0047379.1 alanine racemase [Marinobacterium alkalitolerans]
MYYRDTWAEIDLDRIQHNVSRIKQHSGFEHLYAVVKANAYGHGDVEVARAALEAGADMLSVAFLDEALHLRRAIKDVPILVMGAIRPSDLAVAAEMDIDVTAHDLQWIEAALCYEGKPVNLHLKVDTGMHRIGMTDAESVRQACELIDSHSQLNRVGLFTHFATADAQTRAGYDAQMQQLERLTAEVDLSTFRYVHLSNSAALLRFGVQSGANTGRLGISMYGLPPSHDFELPFELEQAFSLHSRITQVKTLEAGSAVSYGGTFVADEPVRIGVIPIGYADGWLRYHQGRSVEIHGKRYPIVGRICMDQCMIQIDDSVQVGDQVDLLNDNLRVEHAARDLKTISYEIVCSISDRVPRVYKRGGVVVGERNERFRPDLTGDV